MKFRRGPTLDSQDFHKIRTSFLLLQLQYQTYKAIIMFKDFSGRINQRSLVTSMWNISTIARTSANDCLSFSFSFFSVFQSYLVQVNDQLPFNSVFDLFSCIKLVVSHRLDYQQKSSEVLSMNSSSLIRIKQFKHLQKFVQRLSLLFACFHLSRKKLLNWSFNDVLSSFSQKCYEAL